MLGAAKEFKFLIHVLVYIFVDEFECLSLTVGHEIDGKSDIAVRQFPVSL